MTRALKNWLLTLTTYQGRPGWVVVGADEAKGRVALLPPETRPTRTNVHRESWEWVSVAECSDFKDLQLDDSIAFGRTEEVAMLLTDSEATALAAAGAKGRGVA